MIKKFFLSIVIIFLLTGTAFGEPSRIMRKAMDTPASVFDVYLFNIYEREKCPSTDGFIDGCMTNIFYNFEDNLVIMTYSLDYNSKSWIEFTECESDEKRKEFLKNKLSLLTKHIGIGLDSGNELNLINTVIWNTPIRHGYTKKDFDEDEFRDEIIKRTEILLFVDLDGRHYSIHRDHYGIIDIRMPDTNKDNEK